MIERLPAAPRDPRRAPTLTLVSGATVVRHDEWFQSHSERQSMAIHRDLSILVDRVMGSLGLQAENAHLILRSKRQIAICARNADRRMKSRSGAF
jgi:hypothetical protein